MTVCLQYKNVAKELKLSAVAADMTGRSKNLAKLTTLRLHEDHREQLPGNGSQLRYAFLVMLAANVFVAAGALSFGVLYFWR